MTNKGLNIREGRTYLDASHGKGNISFVSPAYGPNTYAVVGNQILEAGLKQPTMAQNASLVHSAWQNPQEKYSADIIQKLKSNWLWCFNGLLYVPSKGVYVADRPEILNGRAVMDEKSLVKKLESKDPSVRFVPFGFKRESQTPSELTKNPFVIALAGEEGADKLAEVAGKYKNKPYVWALDNVNEPTIRVADLDSYVGDDRLGVGGCNWGDSDYGGCNWVGYDGGYAFGVCDSAEGNVEGSLNK